MKNIVYISLLLMLFFSCTSRTIYKKPENLIDKEKMITVWAELYIATGAKSVKTNTSRSKINYAPLVLDKYKIDSVQFIESNIYYTSRIDEYEKMFEEVQKRLENLKKTYEPDIKEDSIIPVLNEPIDSLKKEKRIRKKLLKKTDKSQSKDLLNKTYK